MSDTADILTTASVGTAWDTTKTVEQIIAETRVARLNMPRATLAEAKAQAKRVMAAAAKRKWPNADLSHSARQNETKP